MSVLAADGSAAPASTESAGSGTSAPAGADEQELQAEYDALDPELKKPIEDEQRAEADRQVSEHFFGFQNALRLGFEIPFGDVPVRGGGFPLDVDSLDDYVDFRVPIWLDLGFRIDPNWWVGPNVQVGVGPAGGGCPGTVDCFWTDFRLGFSAKYHYLPTSRWDPWVGLGFNWEWLETAASSEFPVLVGTPPVTVNQTFRFRRNLNGPQIVLDAGADYYLGSSVALGPYFATNVGWFVQDSVQCPADAPVTCPVGTGVASPAFHGGIGIGVRGRFGP